MGILFSRLVGWGLGMISDDFPMLYSSGITVVALACSSAIGIIFGFIPARNAARLNPIDALAKE